MIKTSDGNYIYLVIPIKYKCVYEKLCIKFADIGINILNDCAATCGEKNKVLINSWNMFQSACISYNIGDTKTADFLVDYIIKQLDFDCQGYIDDEIDDTVHQIYYGNYLRSIEEFKAERLEAIINSNNKIEVNSSKLEFNLNQTARIFWLAVPETSVTLKQAKYINEGLVSTLWNNDTKQGDFRTDIQTVVINNVRYKIYYNYVISEIGLKSPIELTFSIV